MKTKPKKMSASMIKAAKADSYKPRKTKAVEPKVSAKRMREELEPADPQRCQALKHNGYNFMTLGGRPGMVRCKTPPVVIAVEAEEGADGQRGSMSVCAACLVVMSKQMPGKFTLEELPTIT